MNRMTAIALMGAIIPAQAGAQANNFTGMGQETSMTSCAGPVTATGDIVVLSMYGGRGAPVSYVMEGAEHETRAVSVSGSGSGPVTLVLSAYEPTVWDLSAVKGRVRGVIASGFYPQAIAGLPAGVPVQFESVHGAKEPEGQRNGTSPCNLGYVHESMYKIQGQADKIRSILGAYPRRWYGGYDPSSFNIDGGDVTAPISPRGKIRSGVPAAEDGLMGGTQGIEQMISAGLIRRIGKADIDAWITKGGRLQITGRMADFYARANHDPLEYIGSSSSGYLILKSIDKLPAGLGGAEAVVFIVPDGVRTPLEAGHSTFFRLTGYPGIPPAGSAVAPDARMQMISRSNDTFKAAPTQVEWDADGRVTRNETRERAVLGGSRVSDMPEGSYAGRPTYTPASLKTDAPATENGEDARALRIIGSFLAIVLVVAGAGWWYIRRKRQPMRPAPKSAVPAGVAQTPMVQRATRSTDAPPAAVPSAERSEDWNPFIESVQGVIAAAIEDETILSVTRFSRRVRQMTDNRYDDDLCDALDAVVEVDFPEYVGRFTSAAKRASSADMPTLEKGMRAAITGYQGRLDAIAQQQTSRDIARLNEHEARMQDGGRPDGEPS